MAGILDRTKTALQGIGNIFNPGPVPEPRVSDQTKKPDTASVGGTGVAIFSGFVRELGEYNAAFSGWAAMRIYDKMRRQDADCQALEMACTLPIRAAKWKVVPGAKEGEPQFGFAKQLAKEVEENLFGGLESPTESGAWNTQSFKSVIYNALLSVPFGCAGHEILWHIDGSKVRLRQLAPRLPITFYRFFPEADGETLAAVMQYGYRGNAFITPQIPAEDFTLFTVNQEGANYYGRSIFRAAYKHWWMKDQAYRIYAIAIEKNAIGVPTVKQGPGASQEDKTASVAWAKNLAVNEQTSLSLPYEWDFELKGISGRILDPMSFIQHQSQMIMRAGLNEFMKLGDTQSGSRAVGNVFVDFFYLSLEAIAGMVAERITHSEIRHYCDYNYRGGLDGKRIPYPRLEVSNVAIVNLLDLLAAIKDVANANVDLIQPSLERDNWIAERLGWPLLEEGKARLRYAPVRQTETESPAPGETASQIESGIVKVEPPAKPGESGNQKAKGGAESTVDSQKSKAKLSDSQLSTLDFRRYPLNRALKPHELKHDFDAHGDRQDKTTRQVARVLRQAKPAMVREAARQASQLGVQGMMRLALPFDHALAQRLAPLLKRAHAFGKDQVYAERKRATRRSRTTPPMKLVARQLEENRNPEFRIQNSELAAERRVKRPLAAHQDNPQFVAEATVTDLQGWVTRAAQTAATDLMKQGLTRQELEGEIAGAVLGLTDGALDRMGMEAARAALGGGRGDALGELQDEISRWIRTEAMDQNTCDPCGSGDGTEWGSYDEIDWSPGDDCEGGDACRGQIVGVFADEGQLVNE